jgi:hypothetical protein
MQINSLLFPLGYISFIKSPLYSRLKIPTQTKGTRSFLPPMSTPPRAVKMSKTINKNDKNFKFQNPLRCMYLTQPNFREFLKIRILIFLQKRLFRIKTAITFAYELGKLCNIWKNYLLEKLQPISTVVGRLHKILLLKISKGNMKAGRFQILPKKTENFFWIFWISFVVYSTF